MKNKTLQLIIVISLFFIGRIIQDDIGFAISFLSVWYGFIIFASYPFDLAYKLSSLIVFASAYLFIEWRINIANWFFPYPSTAMNWAHDIGDMEIFILIAFPLITLVHFFFKKRGERSSSGGRLVFWIVVILYSCFSFFFGAIYSAYGNYYIGKSLIKDISIQIPVSFVLICAYYYFIKQSYSRILKSIRTGV